MNNPFLSCLFAGSADMDPHASRTIGKRNELLDKIASNIATRATLGKGGKREI